MKLEIASHLPRSWPRARGLVAQAGIPVNLGRLRMKVLVFRTAKDLRTFWKRRFGQDIGRECIGVVNTLSYSVLTRDGHEILRVDGRYFCVMGLIASGLTMRVLSHECVHAGYSYAKRRARNYWDKEARSFDEEAIAYPTGEIARALVTWLNRMKLVTCA
jgi:hypothetical protein